MPPRTLEDVGDLIDRAASESAQTNRLLGDEVIPRLDRLEEQSREAGLNGHTAFLRKFLDEYAAGQTRDQAWTVVRADLGQRLRGIFRPFRGIGRTLLVLIGAASDVAWAILGAINIARALHP